MTSISSNTPLLGFVAFSGTGKTTLLVKLLPLLKARGLRIAMIKHAHHEFDIDKPGKDSYELRKAGATQMLVASAKRWAFMVENPSEQDPQLRDLLGHLDHDRADLILVEGFKHVHFPKIELHREVLGKPWLFPEDDSIIAVACDSTPPQADNRPILDINDTDAIVEFVINYHAETGQDNESATIDRL